MTFMQHRIAQLLSSFEIMVGRGKKILQFSFYKKDKSDTDYSLEREHS